MFQFNGEDSENMDWYDNIQEAIWELKSKRATLRKPFSSVVTPLKPRKRLGTKRLKETAGSWKSWVQFYSRILKITA